MHGGSLILYLRKTHVFSNRTSDSFRNIHKDLGRDKSSWEKNTNDNMELQGCKKTGLKKKLQNFELKSELKKKKKTDVYLQW